VRLDMDASPDGWRRLKQVNKENRRQLPSSISRPLSSVRIRRLEKGHPTPGVPGQEGAPVTADEHAKHIRTPK
jgi:hypothetical protein